MKHFLATGTFVVVVGLWAACWLYLPKFLPERDARGQFGDQFGSVNTLFSGLAFAVISLTLYAQHGENRRQEQRFREELRRREVESTAQQEANVRQEERFQEELARRENEFNRHTHLRALTCYAELCRELWQHAERQLATALAAREKQPAVIEKWESAKRTRYAEMMTAWQELQKLLKATG